MFTTLLPVISPVAQNLKLEAEMAALSETSGRGEIVKGRVLDAFGSSQMCLWESWGDRHGQISIIAIDDFEE
jgi:hypothetical protein